MADGGSDPPAPAKRKFSFLDGSFPYAAKGQGGKGSRAKKEVPEEPAGDSGAVSASSSGSKARLKRHRD